MTTHQKSRAIAPENWFQDPELSLIFSGTVKKSKMLGLLCSDMAKHEAMAHVLGYYWECVKPSIITIGSPLAEGDCPAITEAGWFAYRWQVMRGNEDQVALKWIVIQGKDSTIEKQGLALVLEKTTISWLHPQTCTAFCMIAEFDAVKGAWGAVQNPF